MTDAAPPPLPDPDAGEPSPPTPPDPAWLLALAALAHVLVAGAAVPLLLTPRLSVAGAVLVLVLDGLAALALGGTAAALLRGRAGPHAERVLLAVLALAAVATALRTAATREPWAGADAVATLLAVLAVRSPRAAHLALAVVAGAWAGGAAAGLWREPVDAARLAGALVPAAALGTVLVAVQLLHRALVAGERRLEEVLQTSSSRSVQDDLTGVANRRGLEMVAGPMLEHARRQGGAVHCLFVDVDGFRAVNETAGHERGDAVLLAVVEAVRVSVRGTDVIARWSGDEFVVLGPGTGTSPLEMERRMRAYLLENPPVPADVWQPRVSIGSAALVPWDDGDLGSLMRRADQDMQLRRTLRRQRDSRSDRATPPSRPVPGGAEH